MKKIKDYYCPVYWGTKNALDEVIPLLKPHKPDVKHPENTCHLGELASEFEAGTEQLRDALAINDHEAAFVDLVTGGLHWAHAHGLDVRNLLAEAVAHFTEENNNARKLKRIA